MVNNRRKKWFKVFTLIAILVIALSCDPWSNEVKEKGKNFEDLTYSIDSKTILESLDRGDNNVFTLLKATPTPIPLTSQPSRVPSWHLVDYFRVAQALHQRDMHEPLGVQNLYYMSFDMDCAEVEHATFYYAKFSSFKTMNVGKEETRIDYSILIQPSDNLVSTFKGEYTPNIKTRQPINLTHYRISIEQALQIAEKNGGADQRLNYKNDCEIYVRAPVSNTKGWEVSYSINRNKAWYEIFDIVIDSQNGAFDVLKVPSLEGMQK
jgi:hypothetical protein